jgi:hypothetical protein
MNLLDSISDRFKISFSEKLPVEIFPTDPPDFCQCGSRAFWLPRGQSGWRCESCTPPPSRALVAERRDGSPTLAGESLVTYCMPWCESCGGWQGKERVWSDWSIEIHCATCGSEMPEVPRVRPARGKTKSIVEGV